jgi:hypothetical protein
VDRLQLVRHTLVQQLDAFLCVHHVPPCGINSRLYLSAVRFQGCIYFPLRLRFGLAADTNGAVSFS